MTHDHDSSEPLEIDTCSVCGDPAHATETDDFDRCESCAKSASKYTVSAWGSHPDEGNDDCWLGGDYPTEAKARAVYADSESFINRPYVNWGSDVAFVTLSINDEIVELKANPGFVADTSPDDDDAWRSEARMQSAMAHGVMGWNDWEGC